MIKLLKFWMPSLLLMAIIFILSSQSDIPGPPDPLLNRILKKSAHAIGYGMLAISYARALAHSGVQQSISFALCFAMLYGISDEWHQTFVPNRFGSPLDVLIDTIGASVGLFIWQRTEAVKTAI